MAHLSGKFVWFEHYSTDIPGARRFYEGLFGWHTELMPLGAERYPMIMAGSDGVGGYSQAEPGAAAHWRSYLSVADVDDGYNRALQHGAVSVQPPTDFAPVGRGAVVRDPTGALLALWTSAQGDAPDTTTAPAGHFCWNELTTPDASRALEFYREVFGYESQALDMGPQGTYHVLSRNGQQRAGLMQCPEAGMPAMWLPYVSVPDADATAAKAESLGARLMMPVMDVPNVGRMGMATDPLGAAIAFIRLNDMGT